MRATLPQNVKLVILVTTLALGLLVAALEHAVRYYGHPIGGMFVDPDGVVSSVGLPTWSGIQAGLRFPNRVTAVDGTSLDEDATSRYRARAFDAAVERAYAQGRNTVHATIATSSGKRAVELTIEPLSPIGWWTYAGSLYFAGSLYLIASLLALWTSPEGSVARSFTQLALTSFVFLVTLFDFHTTRALVPAFYFAFAMLPPALVILPLRLPDDIPAIRSRPWIARGLSLLGAAWGAVGAGTHLMGGTTTKFQIISSGLLGLALVFFAVAFVFRFFLARDRRRQILKIFSCTTLVPHVFIGVGLFAGVRGPIRSTLDLVSMPTLALTPLAMVVAFVRHDAWSSRALLSRITARTLIGFVTCLLAIAIGAMIASDVAGVPFAAALVGSTAGAIVAAALVSVALAAGDRTLFPSRAEYKPTVEQLSEELTSIASPDDVARAVERTVRRWLPCDRIRFVLALDDSRDLLVDEEQLASADDERRERDEYPSDPVEPADGAQEGSWAHALQSGECRVRPVRRARRRASLEPMPDEVTVPVRFQGRLLGQLRVGQKRGGALFTTEDMDLLRTIANQGALALAHAAAYAELERRRRTQVAAWRDEREALVETVAAEIAHEVRYPINFFRSIFRRGSSGGTLDSEDIEIGCEEVDRLERLVSGLRRMAPARLEIRRVRVSDLCARAEVLLRDALAMRKIQVEVLEPSDIHCDLDKVTQILVNLLANALDATGENGQVGVRWTVEASGRGKLVVWDDGPGFEGDSSRLFAPWYTTKPRGTGLGLAIAYRLVRAHGWAIDAGRQQNRTVFSIAVPSADVLDLRAEARGVA